MTRRASLPGADELFRANTPALSAVRQVVEAAPAAPTSPQPVGTSQTKTKKGVRTISRRRVTAAEKSPSGRELHEEKITVYLSTDEARLMLRGDLGLAVDRGRIVRESIAVIIADLEAKGDQSILARRLRGL